MNDQNISPIKNIMKNELANKSKRLFLKSAKPINNLQVSSQFRVCNRRYFEHDQQEEPKKINHKNINNIKTNNFFLINNVPKNYVSISQEKTQKNQKMHEENLKKLKELEKLLDDLEKKNISLSNDIDQLKNEEDTLKNDLKNKEDEEKELNTELDNLKNINEEKNREYSELMNQNIQQQNDRHNNNNQNSNLNNNRTRVNNNLQNNNSEDQISINDLLNRVLRMQRNVIRENNQEEINNNNSNQQSINNSIMEDNAELGENLGPPMTFAQIDALPSEKYPKRDTYDEKCVICGFNLFYNDAITKLVQCQHIFHKECLGNLLMRKQGSKCPICKVSLI
jgi:chromosome segregation ATPase